MSRLTKFEKQVLSTLIELDKKVNSLLAKDDKPSVEGLKEVVDEVKEVKEVVEEKTIIEHMKDKFKGSKKNKAKGGSK